MIWKPPLLHGKGGPVPIGDHFTLPTLSRNGSGRHDHGRYYRKNLKAKIDKYYKSYYIICIQRTLRMQWNTLLNDGLTLK